MFRVDKRASKEGERKEDDGVKEVANSIVRSEVGTSDHRNPRGVGVVSSCFPTWGLYLL